MRRYIICLFFGVGLSIFLTGCWDQVEIEKRGFIIGIAFDLAQKKGGELDAPEEKKVYKGTYQFVIPSGLGQGGSSQGNSSSKAYNNLVVEGETISEQINRLAGQTSRTPFSEHLQTIILSESLVRIPQVCSQVLDFFLRDNETRRGIHIFVAEGEAGPILDIPPIPENLPVMYIDSIAKNSFKNATILPEKRIGTLHEHFISKKSFVLPKIKRKGQKINITGAAVFDGHNTQMVGFINGEITEGLNMITNEYKQGSLKTKVEDKPVVYDIKREKSSVKVQVKNKDDIRVYIKIKTEGVIEESFVSLDYMNAKVLSKVEIAAEKEIERKVAKTIKVFQKDLKVDALGLSGYVEREDYEIWKQLEKNWDHGKNFFSKSTIKVQADVTVQTPGAIINSK